MPSNYPFELYGKTAELFPPPLPKPIPSILHYNQVQPSSEQPAVVTDASLGQIAATPSTIIENEHAKGPPTVDDISHLDRIPDSDLASTYAASALESNADTSHIEPTNDEAANAPHTLLSQFDTQSSNVPEMRKALSAMMLAENFTQGDTQTQLISASQAQDNGPPIIPAKRPSSSTTPALSQSVAQRLNGSNVGSREGAQAKASDDFHTTTDGDESVSCLCEYNELEGEIVGNPQPLTLALLTHRYRFNVCTVELGNICTAMASLDLKISACQTTMSATNASSSPLMATHFLC
jgi:hypothetical protein